MRPMRRTGGRLLSQRLTAFALDWPRDVPIGDATLEDDFGALLEFNRLLGWWAMGEPIDAASIADPATRALAHAMRGERSEAEEWLERAIDTAPDSIVDLGRGDRPPRSLGTADRRRARDRGGRARRTVPEPRRPHLDAAARPTTSRRFRTYPADGFVSGAQRLGTSPPYPWILQQTLP